MDLPVKYKVEVDVTDTNNHSRSLQSELEQHISYIFIYYRWRLQKGVAIFDAAGINSQQKLLF